MVVDRELHPDRLIFNLCEVSLQNFVPFSLLVSTHHITTDYHYNNYLHVTTISYKVNNCKDQLDKTD